MTPRVLVFSARPSLDIELLEMLYRRVLILRQVALYPPNVMYDILDSIMRASGVRNVEESEGSWWILGQRTEERGQMRWDGQGCRVCHRT